MELSEDILHWVAVIFMTGFWMGAFFHLFAFAKDLGKVNTPKGYAAMMTWFYAACWVCYCLSYWVDDDYMWLHWMFIIFIFLISSFLMHMHWNLKPSVYRAYYF